MVVTSDVFSGMACLGGVFLWQLLSIVLV